MNVAVSMKGVTILTDGQYKRRHSGSKEVLEQPVEGFKDRKIYYKERPWEKPQKVKKKKSSTNPQIIEKKEVTQPKPEKEKKYTIDKKQVSHRILNYVNQMKGEKLLYFWTITFPAKTPDETCNRLWNLWLTRLRKERMIREYLWITERQKNGTLHYHICINNRMNVQKANKFMRAAIMTAIDRGEVIYSRTDAAKYNGVDIAKNRKTKRVTNFAKKKHQKALSNYITKYVSKSDEKFQNLAWHNSRGYSNLIIQINLTSPEFFSSTLRALLELDKPIEDTYFTFFRWKGSPPPAVLDYLAMINQKVFEALGID